MAPRLANTIFQGRSTDKLATVDVYEAQRAEQQKGPQVGNYNPNGQAPGSSGVDFSRVDKNAFLGSIDENQNSYLEMDTAQSRADLNDDISTEEKINYALMNLGSSWSEIESQIKGEIKDKIISATAGVAKENLPEEVSVRVDDVETIVRDTNIRDTNDLLRIADAMLGGDTVLKAFEHDTQAAIISSVVESLLGIKVPTIVYKMLENLEGDEVRNKTLRNTARQAILASDLELLNWIIDKIGVSAVLETVPTAIVDILSFYTVPDDTPPSRYQSMHNLLVSTLTRLDPEWYFATAYGITCYKLEPYIHASDDARMILKKDVLHRQLSMTAVSYKMKTVNEIVTDLYPDAYIE